MIITEKYGTLEYLTAEGISVPHCFTTRFGGVSTGIFDSMNIAIKEGEAEENVRKNIAILSGAMMLDYLGEKEAAKAIEKSVAYITANKLKSLSAGKRMIVDGNNAHFRDLQLCIQICPKCDGANRTHIFVKLIQPIRHRMVFGILLYIRIVV